MKKTLVIGATSAIARSTARLFAERGDTLFLAARNVEQLEISADDLLVRGANAVYIAEVDVLDFSRHEEFVETAIDSMGGLDLVLVAHGTLPDQSACESSTDLTRRELEVNAVSTISLLTIVASYFEGAKRGTIVAITSVAGDRGRQSNYVYGAAKATVSRFLQGLRNRLHSSGVHVLDVRPGFVDTPMTAAFEKGPLWTTPDFVAAKIVSAISKQRNVIYVPFFWSVIMLVIRSIPERLFKRLKL